jgi:lactoylglutathione lyase
MVTDTRTDEPMVSQLFPIVSTRDIDRALGFYRDNLGGTVSYEFPGPDGRAAYVGLDIGSSHIGIGLEPDLADVPLPRPISLWIYVDDCDATVEQLRGAGVTIREEPVDQPWGERVARVLDPDGNEVVIGAR